MCFIKFYVALRVNPLMAVDTIWRHGIINHEGNKSSFAINCLVSVIVRCASVTVDTPIGVPFLV